MTIRAVLQMAVVAVALAACANKAGEREFQASTSKQPMTADEIRTAFTGNSLTGTAKAKRMQTSRRTLDRLLDPDNTSVTLHTMLMAAAAGGRHVRVALG